MAQDRSEYMKTYRANNKDKYKEYRKNWRLKHKQDEDYKLKQAAYSRHYYMRVSMQDSQSRTQHYNPEPSLPM
jgi:hypothetical protein